MGKLVAARAMPPQEPPPRTRERQALAGAIERRNAARAELERIRHAQDRHREEVAIPAERDLEAATEALEKLKASEELVLAAAYLGDREAASMSDAKKAVDEAKAAVEQADKTRQGLRARQGDAERALESADADLRAAFVAARDADPAIAMLRAEGEEILRAFVDHLRVRKLVEAALGDYRFSSLLPIIEAAFPGLPRSQREQQWRVALESLKSDADATLPDVELPSP